MFDPEFTKLALNPKYLFLILLDNICELKKYKLILSLWNTTPCRYNTILDSESSLEISYLSYDDSMLYWKSLCNKNMDSVYHISRGYPTTLKSLASQSIETLIHKYSLDLIKLKTLFGDRIYSLFASNKGIVNRKEFSYSDNHIILTSKYIYIDNDNICLLPPYIYVLSINH